MANQFNWNRKQKVSHVDSHPSSLPNGCIQTVGFVFAAIGSCLLIFLWQAWSWDVLGVVLILLGFCCEGFREEHLNALLLGTTRRTIISACSFIAIGSVLLFISLEQLGRGGSWLYWIGLMTGGGIVLGGLLLLLIVYIQHRQAIKTKGVRKDGTMIQKLNAGGPSPNEHNTTLTGYQPTQGQNGPARDSIP